MTSLNPNKDYYLMPGPIPSENDGEVHHISAVELARLYGVNLHAENVHVIQEEERGYAGVWEPGNDIFLYPQSDGDYTIPNSTTKNKDNG